MARERVARIRIEAAGSDKVKAALKGISTETDKARASVRALGGEWTKLGALSEAGQRHVAATAQATSRKVADGYRNAEHQYRSELQRSSAEAQESYRSRETSWLRGQTAMRAEAQRTGASIRSSIGGGVASFAAGAGIGAALGAVALVTSTLKSVGEQLVTNLHAVTTALGSRTGTQTMAERTASAAEIDRDIGRIAVQAFGGGTEASLQGGRRQIADTVTRVAERTGIDPSQLVATLGLFQEKFSDLAGGMTQLERLAQVAQATGTPLLELAQASGEAGNILGVTAAEGGDFLGVLTEAGRAGRVTPGEFATAFAPAMGQFRAFRGTSGLAAAREFSALSQGVAQGGGTPEMARTQLEAMLTGLADPETQGRLARAGVFTRERAAGDRGNRRTGARRAVADIIADMQASAGLRTSEQLSTVFGRSEAVQGFQTLMRIGAPQIRAYEQASAEHGAAIINQGFRVYRASEFGQAESTAVRGKIEGIRQLHPRAAQARSALSFAESLQQQGMLGQILAGSDALTEGMGWLSTQGATVRNVGMAAVTSGSGMGAFANLTGISGADPIGDMLRKAMTATRQEAAAKESELRGLRLAEGSTVGIRAGSTIELGPNTVNAIARAVGGGAPGPLPNESRRTPGGPARRP